jgi:hypothetical protein
VGNIFDAATIIGVIGLGLILICTLLIRRAAIPGEIVGLMFDIEPNQVDFAYFAYFVIFVIKELDLIPECLLDSSNKVIMQDRRWNAVSAIHDWEPKTKDFLLHLACWSILLCTTRGGYHSVIVLMIRIATVGWGGWNRSGGAVRHRLLVMVQNLRGSLVEIT